MWTNNKNRIKQLLKTSLAILCVGALFWLALVFPRYYYEHYDNNTLNRVTFTDINVNTFEASYDSFIEKLHALARGFSEEKELRAVQVDEPGFEMSRTELTKITNEELKKFRDKKGVNMDIRVKKKNLVLYERYVLYQVSEGDTFKGISGWKLVYENKKRKLTLFLDEEYHKIYYLENQNKEVTEFDSSSSAVGQYDDYGEQKAFAMWWNVMIRYYGISFEDENIRIEPIDYQKMGNIIFDERYAITLFYRKGYDKYGREVLEMGIPIDKVIQM